jgi:hypothetical protein
MPRKNPPGSAPIKPENLARYEDAGNPTIAEFRTRVMIAMDQYAPTAGIEDWGRIKSIVWRGFCLYCGRTIFSGKLKCKDGSYDIPLLWHLHDLFTELCYTAVHLPAMAVDFYSFCGIDVLSWVRLGERVTPEGMQLRQKVYAEQEASLAMAGGDGRIVPTMALATLNHYHGWTQSREIIHRDGGQILDGGQWASKFIADKSEKPIIEGGKEAGEVVKLPENTE